MGHGYLFSFTYPEPGQMKINDLSISIDSVLSACEEVVNQLRLAREEMPEDDWNEAVEGTPLETLLDSVADLEHEIETEIEKKYKLIEK